MKTIYSAKTGLFVVVADDIAPEIITSLTKILHKLPVGNLKPGIAAGLFHRPAGPNPYNGHWTNPEYPDVSELFYYSTYGVEYGTLPVMQRNAFGGPANDEELKHGYIDHVYNPGEKIGWVFLPPAKDRAVQDCPYPDLQRIHNRWSGYARDLLKTGRTSFTRSMGSCQCGSISVTLWLNPQGLPMVKTEGSEGWQRFEGPANLCNVAYATGGMISLISHLASGNTPGDGDYYAAYS